MWQTRKSVTILYSDFTQLTTRLKIIFEFKIQFCVDIKIFERSETKLASIYFLHIKN